MPPQAHKLIEGERLLIYVLLSGSMVWDGQDRHINVCQGLDWRRVLGLHLWYASSPNAVISDVMEDYDHAFEVSYIPHLMSTSLVHWFYWSIGPLPIGPLLYWSIALLVHWSIAPLVYCSWVCFRIKSIHMLQHHTHLIHPAVTYHVH